jgi:hypothetical protein
MFPCEGIHGLVSGLFFGIPTSCQLLCYCSPTNPPALDQLLHRQNKDLDIFAVCQELLSCHTKCLLCWFRNRMFFLVL